MTTVETMKQLLEEPNAPIKLDDFVTGKLKHFLEEIDLSHFPVQGIAPTKESFIDRLRKYESATSEMLDLTSLLAYWGNPDQLFLLRKILNRMCETDKGSAGSTLWINLGWYPMMLLIYTAGMAALSRERYETLKVILETDVRFKHDYGGKPIAVSVAVMTKITNLNDGFKWLPGRERNYTPRSEYLLETLQPKLENLFFLGQSYEDLFDRFESVLALVYSDHTSRDWGPYGRFAWKYTDPVSADNPFGILVEEAKKASNSWAPIKAGMFQGSCKRFEEVVASFQKKLGERGWS